LKRAAHLLGRVKGKKGSDFKKSVGVEELLRVDGRCSGKIKVSVGLETSVVLLPEAQGGRTPRETF
jgi:hypothetical protein